MQDQTAHLRYPEVHLIRSPLDPLGDMLTFLEFLAARDYVIQITVSRHGLSQQDAAKRAKRIVAHTTQARLFLEQTFAGPTDVSFLSAYYAILNLLKCYVLLGPYHSELDAHRWHGASYNTTTKDSRDLLTEVITLHQGGTIPLLYRTVTGQTFPFRETRQVQMGKMYPYLGDVSAEYTICTGRQAKLGTVSYEPGEDGKGRILPRFYIAPRGGSMPNLRDVKALLGFRRKSKGDRYVAGRPFRPAQNAPHPHHPLRSQLRPFLMYHPLVQHQYGERWYLATTPLSSGHLLLPEELPIALVFFHLSSVVRYKPEFFSRLRESKYWPLVVAARRHCLLKALVLFWSFVHQRTLILTHE